MTLGQRLLDDAKDVTLLVEGRAVTAQQVVDTMRAIDLEFRKHGAGLSLEQFVARAFHAFRDLSLP